nr:hypothetical protein CFP56_03721 [Quercus suber]
MPAPGRTGCRELAWTRQTGLGGGDLESGEVGQGVGTGAHEDVDMDEDEWGLLLWIVVVSTRQYRRLRFGQPRDGGAGIRAVVRELSPDCHKPADLMEDPYVGVISTIGTRVLKLKSESSEIQRRVHTGYANKQCSRLQASPMPSASYASTHQVECTFGHPRVSAFSPMDDRHMPDESHAGCRVRSHDR